MDNGPIPIVQARAPVTFLIPSAGRIWFRNNLVFQFRSMDGR